MKKLFLVAVVLVGVATESGAAETPTSEDVQDVLYLGQGRPALLRLHLQVNGKPLFARYEGFMGKYFRFLDRNHSGGLDRTEASRAPSSQQMLQVFQGVPAGVVRRGAATPTVPYDTLDADRDGKVTLEEFIAYYRTNGAGPVQLTMGYAYAVGQDVLTDRLFEILDTNKDGKLSRQELDSAARTLSRFDIDDNELVSQTELGGTTNPYGVRAAQVALPRLNPAPVTNLMLIPQDSGKRVTSRLQLTRNVIARLDKDKDGKLSQPESGFPQEMFERIDRNRDGQLDVLELSRWLGGKPDGEFTVRLGNGGAMMAPAAAVRRPALVPGRADDSMSVTLDNVRVTVLPVASVPSINMRVNQFILDQFRQIDTEKKGSIARGQVDARQHYYLNGLFDLADRNADGRLTEQEVKDFLALVGDAFGAQATLSLASTGQGLFQTLDANGDGQLGIREMRTAWARLSSFDRDRDGCIDRNEFPQQFRLTVSTGPNYGYAVGVGFAGQPGMPARPVATRGPVWFRKMDRNGDGDVSRVEWLGSKEDFDRIDTDRDGLVSADEAEAADRTLRK